MKRQRARLWVPLSLLLVLSGCSREEVVGEDASTGQQTPFILELPWYFPAMEVPPTDPLTVEGVALGRRLYYDALISSNGPHAGKSCSTCHDQALSFTVPSSSTSVLPHVNLGWGSNFLWNGKVEGTLEDIMRFEVNEFFQVDVNVLRNHPEYPGLFKAALGTDEITQEDVAKALAQWFRRLTSARSRFDQYLLHEITFTPAELNGMLIFLTEKGDCFHCHDMPLMTDNRFHNIGLDSVYSGSDRGRYLITGAAADMGLFKAPSLRNVALTAPYMHDGRFATLEEVIDHYDSGVKPSATLDPIMTKPLTGTVLDLTPTEKADLLAFLHTLTDEAFVTDTALASPF
ncbi:MAG: cytochrome-c peroxidase [Flavobacteriales bacterium]|nr:cytochrome-c peroxidase [Flavobacteriales bacterium]